MRFPQSQEQKSALSGDCVCPVEHARAAGQLATFSAAGPRFPNIIDRAVCGE
jgi:hypothetical protein